MEIMLGHRRPCCAIWRGRSGERRLAVLQDRMDVLCTKQSLDACEPLRLPPTGRQNLYIGFDSADDRSAAEWNGNLTGESPAGSPFCNDANQIQAGFVLGCAAKRDVRWRTD